MPTSSAVAKEDCLSVRVPRSVKANFIRAASIIQSQQLMELSARDYDRLMQALTEPPKPNSALLRAAEAYKKVVADGDLIISY